jgi:hypothetical protein
MLRLGMEIPFNSQSIEEKEMELPISGLIASVSRWTASNGNAKGAKCYILGNDTGENPDLCGLELTVPNMPYDMYAQFAGKKLPAFYDMLLDVQRGGGG